MSTSSTFSEPTNSPSSTLPTPASSAPLTTDDLLAHCQQLLSELQQYEDHLRAEQKTQTVDLRAFRKNLQAERKWLEKKRSSYKRHEEDEDEAEDENEAKDEADDGCTIEVDRSPDGAGPERASDGERDQVAVAVAMAHGLRSSNLPFYRAVWETAKRSKGVVGFEKSFAVVALDGGWPGPGSADGGDATGSARKTTKDKKKNKMKKKTVVVDIVAGTGREWIKVSTMTETKLLFEMAKNGWNVPDDSSGTSSDNEEGTVDQDSAPSLLKLACALRQAASHVLVRNRHPQIRFVLPRIRRGTSTRSSSAIVHLLDEIRRLGITVECAGNGNDNDEPLFAPAGTPFKDVLARMTPDEYADFTPTLNIDCTLLLALVSDLSHGAVPMPPLPLPPSASAPQPEPGSSRRPSSFSSGCAAPSSTIMHIAIRRQIEREAREQLLPRVLWPAMAHRSLVCTSAAAHRTREIVATIGTASERARTALLFHPPSSSSDSSASNRSLPDSDTTRRLFQTLSAHSIPSSWAIPIRVVVTDDDDGRTNGRLPAIAYSIAAQLSPLNRAVVLFGWARHYTTLTSNGVVVKLIETALLRAAAVSRTGAHAPLRKTKTKTKTKPNRGGLEGPDGWEGRKEEEEGEEKEEKDHTQLLGPDIWLCPVARSLVGKEPGQGTRNGINDVGA
ncbi:MAG: hypothetical protein M1826_005567 [Phylliscum demangeonii]|nr:MAG: hypothetical protein M1826_005567 [Phylliscum demangeonii]